MLENVVVGEDYVLRAIIDKYIGDYWTIRSWKQYEFEYLPKQIGEIFPYLKNLCARKQKLRVVRDFYFKNMRHLKVLDLSENKIETIEAGAFKDLTSVEELKLQHNLIETIHVNLFQTMHCLKFLFLDNNKIKFLSPSTFELIGSRLEFISLMENACINGTYSKSWNDIHPLEPDLIANCTPGKVCIDLRILIFKDFIF